MLFLFNFKNTVFLWVFILSACGNIPSKKKNIKGSTKIEPIVVGADRTSEYLPLLKGKNIAVVANQSSVIFKDTYNPKTYTHIVDSLLALNINITKVFAPEHGFRTEADAGEKIKDALDTKTGLPLFSLYGKNKKPTLEQFKDLELVVFDIQDVGVRFYTYIATLQLVMEACAENNIPMLILDRPNPNGHYIDGPTMEAEHTGFLGKTNIPLVYGMTIGEYASMINTEGWLLDKIKVDLTVIPLENYTHKSHYSLVIRPSPNLPNDIAINLYPSLGLFEGTTVNAGRGTAFQFQRYGASFLDSTKYQFSYIPRPNFGSKNPKQKYQLCYGKDLSKYDKLNSLKLTWLLDAYKNSIDKSTFFKKNSFTKHAGTEKLQRQIKANMSEEAIKQTWEKDIEDFKEIRAKYLIYK